MFGRKKKEEDVVSESIDAEESKIRAFRLAKELADMASTLEKKAQELTEELNHE